MKNQKRKFQIAIAAAFSLAFLFQAVSASAAESCGGCKAVDAVAAAYAKTAGKRNDDETVELILKAQSAIKKMPTKQGKLTPAQVTQIVKLLALSTASDPGHAIIDDNIELFDLNKTAFFREFKIKIYEEQREWMEDALSAKLAEFKFGNG